MLRPRPPINMAILQNMKQSAFIGYASNSQGLKPNKVTFNVQGCRCACACADLSLLLSSLCEGTVSAGSARCQDTTKHEGRIFRHTGVCHSRLLVLRMSCSQRVLCDYHRYIRHRDGNPEISPMKRTPGIVPIHVCCRWLELTVLNAQTEQIWKEFLCLSRKSTRELISKYKAAMHFVVHP